MKRFIDDEAVEDDEMEERDLMSDSNEGSEEEEEINDSELIKFSLALSHKLSVDVPELDGFFEMADDGDIRFCSDEHGCFWWSVLKSELVHGLVVAEIN